MIEYPGPGENYEYNIYEFSVNKLQGHPKHSCYTKYCSGIANSAIV